ncbi:MAG: T9SS type A sorting domain-containing protein, partial [Candidatus Eiseniibacteriota bacterium]
ADGAGGVMVVWEEHFAPPRSGLFAQRFGADGPTPALLALASADATPERVLLTWHGEGAGTLAAGVYRRNAASDWERLGAAAPEGPDRLRYEDRTVTAGAHYAYRLGYLEGGLERFTAETWVEVPLAARFALRGLTPNPSMGDPFAVFSLASDEPASLEVYDLHGRLVFAREVGGLGAGAHRLRLGERGRLPAGVYAIRLRQGPLTATARAVVIR